MKRIILSLLAILLCLQSFSQVVRVGNGITNNTEIPFFIDDSTSSFVQQIFTAQEINQNNMYIESIAIEALDYSYLRNGNFSIYIGSTTQSSFLNDFIPLENMTKVFSRDNYGVFTNDPLYDFNDTIALSYIYFDRPYFLDGNSNLVITFVSNKLQNYNCHNDTLGYLSDQTSDPMTRRAYLTYPNTFTIDSTPNFGENSNQRSNIRFNFTTCPNGFNLNVSDIAPNQARISWEENDTTSNWIIEYKLSSEYDWNNANNVYSNDNYIILDSLFENSDYNLRIRNICNDTSFSLWSEISFRTICYSIDTIPYYFDFTTLSDFYPLCWRGSYYVYGGTVKMSVFGIGNQSYFISPPITNDINNLCVKFNGKQSSGTDAGVKFSFGVMSDNNDTSTFVSLFDTLILATSFTDWNFYEVNINNNIVVGTNNYIAFRIEALGSTGGYSIGNVSIDYKLQCSNVYEFKVFETTHNSISFKWNTTNNSHNGYQIAYSQYSDTFNPDSATIINLANTLSPPFIISNLMPSTHYSIAIRQNCGGAWTIIDAYTMGLPATLPYSCNFETQGERDRWMISNGNAVNNWVFGQAVNSGVISGYSMYVSDNDGDSNTMNGQTNSVTTASRLFELNGAGGYTISFNSRVKGDYNDNNMLKVFVVDSNINFDGTESPYLPYYATKNYSNGAILFGGDVGSQYSYLHNNNFPYFYNNANPVVINSHTINIPYQGTNGTVKKIIFLWANRNGSDNYFQRYYPAAIDNITIQENPCASPSISVVNSFKDSVELSWTSGYSDSTWILFYKPINSNEYSFIRLDTTTFVLNCSNQTQYNAYVKVLCGNGNWQQSNVITFSPQCKKITLPFSENFNEYPINTFPVCWYKSNYVVIGNHPANLLNFTYNSYSVSYAILPELEDSISISSAIISFKYRKAVYNGTIVIGVMTDKNDLSTFDTLATLSAASTDYLWRRYEINLNNYSGSGRYIAILGQYQSQIDDILVDYYNSCPNVYDLNVDSVASSTVSISWDTSNSQSQGYQFSYLLLGNDLSNETIITHSDSAINIPYQITGLNPSSNYRIGIRTNCGGNWSYINITTKGAPATLPYSCDFSNLDERESWFISNGNAPNAWVIGQEVNSMPISGYSLFVSQDNGLTNSYYRGTNQTSPTTIAASRLFKATGSTGYILTFDSRMGGEAGYDFLKVYVVDEDTIFGGSNSSPYFGNRDYSVGNVLYGGNNGANPTYPYFCSPSNPDSINNHTINIPYLGTNGTVKRLVFVWHNDASDYNQPPASIDNISLTVNYCSAPELILNSINHVSADISWNKHPDDSSWYLYYKELDAINYDSIHIINDTNYILNNLSSSTTYNLYFKKDCGTSLSDSRDTISFSTPCNPITQLPFYEDFETFNSSNYIDCWNIINPLNVYPPMVVNNNGYQNSYYLSVESYSVHAYSLPNTGIYTILPAIDTSININNLLMKFIMIAGYNNIIVGMMSDVNDETTFDSITTFSSDLFEWEEKIVYFNNYVGNGRNIAFKGIVSTSYSYFGIDNVYINDITNCIAPTNLTATNISKDSVELSWIVETIPPASYWLYYKKVDDNVFDSIFTTSMTYNLSGLDHSSLYKVYVRAYCTNGMSDNSDTISFRTQCSAINVFPYEENFENYLSYGLNNPYCWSFYVNGINIWHSDYINLIREDSNTYMRTSNFGINYYTTTPEIDEDINLLKLSFSSKSDNVNNFLLVGIMSDVSDNSTFEQIRSIPLTPNLSEYEVYFNEATLSGNNKYIAFKLLNYGSFALDNIIIDYIPDCSRPSNVIADNITSTEAEINITSFNNNPTSWWLFYKRHTDAIYDSVHITSLPYTLSGLEPISRYQVYAKNECGQEISINSNVFEFWTSCYEIASIPHLEDFEIDFSWIEYINIFNHYPPCWTTYNNNKPFIVNDPGNYLLRFSFNYYSNYNDYKIAITPKINDSILISSLKVSFDYRRYSSHSIDIIVGVMSNPDNLSTFDSIASLTPIEGSWNNGVVDFSSYSGNGQYVAFLLKNRVTNNGNQMDIDNLLFEYNSSYQLPTPINPSITNITDSSALFSWQRGGNETIWDVTLDTTITPVQVTDTSYTFNNLIGATPYIAYVRAVDYAISPWVAINFATLVTIVEGEVETLDASSITDTSATLNGVLASNGNAINNIDMGFLLHNEPQINLLSQGVVKIPISYRDSITTFNYNLTNLPSDSTFYYTTYFSNIAGDVYGTVKHFSTLTLSEDIIKEDLTINIFPNPTNNISVLRINNLKEKAIVSIYDLQGRQIKTYDIEANQKELTLNMKDYSPGMYYVKLKTRTINKTNKLIVNR